MRAAGRLLALAHLAVLTVAVAATPAIAADRDGESGLTVSVDGVSFEPARLWSEWGAVSYAISAPDGSHERYYSDSYGPRESSDGFLGFSVSSRTYPDGYCVTWAHVSGLRQQFARWNGDTPVCTTTQVAPAPTPAPPTTAPTPEAPPATDAPASVATPPADAADVPVEAEDTPEPVVTEEPTQEPTTEAPVEPTPTAEPSAPEPSRTPLTSAAGRMAPPPPAAESFPTLAVVGVGGLVAAAAGGAILLLRRVG